MEHMEQVLVDDRYTLVELLGDGGMAQVYLAHDEVLDRDVALKILREQYAKDEGFVERFKREAQSAAGLSHPNIVQVYDRGCSEDGSYYIAMEYVRGGTLKDRISRERALEPREAAAVAAQISEALRAAHERGIVHRDVKPQNVLLTEGGDVKVADFGIVRAAAATTISQTGLILGTASYMSPEQALGKPVTPESDLYSLGVVLYEMLTGRVPFEAENPVAVAMKHVTEPPRPPAEVNPKVPEGIEALTMRLLAKDLEERYGNAAELTEDLGRVRDGFPPIATGPKEYEKTTAPLPTDLEGWTKRTAVQPHVTAPAATPGPDRRRRDRLFPIMGALLLGLVLLGGVAWALAQGFGVRNVEVPSLEGLTREEAQEQLAESGLTLGDVGETPSDSAPIGTILEQDPQAGASVEPETSVNITLSSGPEQVAVPDLAGLSSSEAERALSETGLKLGRQNQAPSDMVPAGAVAEQDPAEGTKVEPDTAVDVTVSTGPQQQAPAPQAAPAQPAAPALQAAPPVAREDDDEDDDRGRRGRGRGGDDGGGRGGGGED